LIANAISFSSSFAPKEKIVNRLRIAPLVRSLALVCLMLFIFLVPPVHAAAIDLSNNLENAPGSGNPITTTNWYAQSFATDATHRYITTVVVGLCSFSSTTGAYNVEIWDATGAGNTPGSAVAIVAANVNTTNPNSCSTSNTPGPTFSGLAIALNPSTTYYLVVRLLDVANSARPPERSLFWAISSTGGPGFPSNRSSWNGSTWSIPITQLPQMMRIVADTGLPTITTLTGPSGNFTSVQPFTFTAAVQDPNNTCTNGGSSPNCAPVLGSNSKTLARAPKQTGTVTFYDNNVAIPTCTNVPLDVGTHQATCTVTLAAGSHVITVVYNGDSNYVTSTSNALPITITLTFTPRDVPEGDTLLLLGGGFGGLATWVRWQWSKHRKNKLP
jgi:hypothetical protein